MLTTKNRKTGEKEAEQVKLLFTADIENTFIDIVRDDSSAFRDEASLAVMKAIDEAERVGEYGVITPLGKSCITCLCTGGKTALLILHYNKKGIVPLVSYYSAGENVWEFLTETDGIQAYIKTPPEEMIYFGRFLRNGSVDRRALLNERLEYEDEVFEMTKAKEREAYARYVERDNNGEPRVFCNIAERLPMREFMKRFLRNEDLSDCWDEEKQMNFWEECGIPMEFTVVNSCPVLWQDLNWRKHPFYILGERLGSYELRHELTVKYPTFPEMMVDMMTTFFDYEEQEEYRYADLYDSWFCMALDCEERMPVRRYTDGVLCGLEVDPSNKLLRIYSREEAIEIFHDRYQKNMVRERK